MEQITHYRFEIFNSCSMDEWDNVGYVSTDVHLYTYGLYKETPKGYWIQSDKWVSKTSKKRYAYPTKKEAMQNFILRNEKRIEILQEQINKCSMGIRIAKDKFRDCF